MSRLTEAQRREILSAVGFVRQAGTWRRGQLTFHTDGDWSRLEVRGDGRDITGRGLWRRSRDPELHVFEIPGRLEAGDPGQTFAQMLEFGVAGHEDRLSASTVPEDLPLPRTVRNGPGTSQGRWQVTPRLTLRYPLVVWPASASRERIAWLERTLDEARCWRLVRVDNDGDGHVYAEVELTGAPEGLIAPLAHLAQDALAAAVAWLLPSMSVLAEHEVRAIAALRRRQPRGRARSQTPEQQEIHS